MRLVYDDVGDILYIDLVEPYEEQESDMISDTVIVRTNPDTARVESLEFLFFSESMKGGGPVELPIGPDMIADWETIDALTRSREPRPS